MPSPLMRGEYFLRPKPAGTKEEVLARMKGIILENLKKPFDCEATPWLDRMEAHLIRRRASEIWDDNYKASFLPDWSFIGPRQPNTNYVDDRLRKYIGRYDSTRSD